MGPSCHAEHSAVSILLGVQAPRWLYRSWTWYQIDMFYDNSLRRGLSAGHDPGPRDPAPGPRATLAVRRAGRGGDTCRGGGWVPQPTIEYTQRLMSHKNIHLILATGGPAMVLSAARSKKMYYCLLCAINHSSGE